MIAIFILGIALAFICSIFIAVSWEKLGPLSIMVSFIAIVVACGFTQALRYDEPTALDVYRNKTTLVIHKETHDSTTLITDSVVEYKPQFRNED